MAQTKATATKKSTKKRAVTTKPASTRSNFFEVRLTEQTLYWTIFGIASIAFALWLYSLDARVRDLYDQVDASTNSMNYSTERAADEVQN